MANNANPNIDPGNYSSLVGTLNAFLNNFILGIDNRLPAMVVGYDRETKLAQVQPLIKMINTNGELISRAAVSSVPVEEVGGGGAVLSFPLVAGDLGFIKATDTDMSLFLKSFTEQPPNTFVFKNFASSVFCPCVMNGYVLNTEDENNPVFQLRDGTVRIALWPEYVKITAPEGLIVEGNLEVSGDMTVNGNLTLNGSGSGSGGGVFTVSGNLRVNGDITAGGSITPNVP